MSNIRKRIALLVTAVSVAATAVTGCGQAKPDNDAVVVTVGEEKVTMGVANFFARYQQAMAVAQYGAYMGENMWGIKATETETMEDTVKKNIIESLEKLYVLEAHMKDYKVELTDEENKNIEKAAKEFLKANGEEEKEMISANEENVKKVLSLITIEEKMRAAIIADVDTNVSDKEAAQKSMQYVFFPFAKQTKDGTNAMMDEKEKAELKKEAEAFLKMVKEEKDFDKAAERGEYIPNTATFDKESVSPAAELVKAADTLKKGEVTDVIEASSGYYVAKVTSMFDKEATETKKASIVTKRQNEKFMEVTDKLVKETKIKLNEKEWKKVSFKKQEVTVKPQEKKDDTKK